MSTNDPEKQVDVVANLLFTSLTQDIIVPPVTDLSTDNFSFTPDDKSLLYEDLTDISIDELTRVDLDGEGVFDKMMKAVDLHINREFKDNRITGDQYANVYTQVITGVLSNATQFLLSKEQSRWQGIQAQMQARVAEVQSVTARIELERAKVETSKATYDMQNSGAQYALTKVNIANAQAQHCLLESQTFTSNYTNENILPITFQQERYKLSCQLPVQTQLLNEQVEKERAQTLDTRTDGITPVSGVIGIQKDSLNLDVETKRFTLDNTLPIQLELVREQRESERAKTVDTRTDGTDVVGSVGKQKDLYTQQIDSFKKDAQHKTAKMYLDGWITQKTLDEGLLAPSQLQNTNVDTVLSGVRTANEL